MSGGRILLVIGLVVILSGFVQCDIVPNLVLGQGGVLDSAEGLAIDAKSGALFISDTLHNRILRFENRCNLNSNSSPSVIFGQPNVTSFNSNGGQNNTNQRGLYEPQGIAVDSQGTLWVADWDNNRVLGFNASSPQTFSAAGKLLGQNTWITNTYGLSPSALNHPTGIRVFNQDLWVVDQFNNRVLGFAAGGLNPVADAVVGQSGFTSMATSPFNSPQDVLVTSNGVFVSDVGYSRVLFFATSNLTEPIGVLGQESVTFARSSSAPAPNTFTGPIGLASASDGTLFVADSSNNRILIFTPLTNEQLTNGFANISAIGVIGAPTLFANGTGILQYPTRLVVDELCSCLWVSSSLNSLVLRYPIVLSTSVNNSISSGVQVSFQPGSPTVSISPKDSSGTANPNATSLSFSTSSSNEVTPDGNIVQRTTLPIIGYSMASSLDSQSNQQFQFSTILSNNATINLDYTLFARESTVKSGGTTSNVQAGTLKLSLTLNAWNFSSSSNNLHINMIASIKPSITSQSSSSSSNSTSFIFESSNIMITTIQFLQFGIIDDSTIVPLNISFNSTTSTDGESSLIDFSLVVPFFSTSFNYDPNFSVTLVGSGGGDGGSNNLLPLLALIALVIPLFFVLVAVIVIAWWVVTKKLKHRMMEQGSVNWGKQDEEADDEL